MLHSAFYCLTPIADPPRCAQALRQLAQGLCGSIIVATEGLSGAVAGEFDAVAAFEQALLRSSIADGALANVKFRHSTGQTPPFGKLKVGVKPELVAVGLPANLARENSEHIDPGLLTPHQWDALLQRENLVLLDNRNHFEYRLGHFHGATDPQVGQFRSFVDYVESHAPTWRSANAAVAMYCTGGIRCAKTAPWMRSLGLEVWHLEGGILNYLAKLGARTERWQGECFVFDNRIALDQHLRETPTRAEAVYDRQNPDEQWRLQRAQRLADALGPD